MHDLRPSFLICFQRGNRGLSLVSLVSAGELGQAIRSDKQLPHWFDVSQWIRLA